jgi:branched-chain amino acid transport system substrate-binding protein
VAITRTQTIGIVVAVIVIIVAATAAWYFFLRPPPPPPAPEKIKVGLSISLSGKYARKGEYSLQAIQLWADWVNEQGGIYVEEYKKKIPVEIVYYDDKSEKETAITLYEKLILEDKVHVSLCPYSSTLTYAITPVTDKYKMIAIAHGAASVKIYERGLKYVVQVISPSTFYVADSLRLLDEYLEDHPELSKPKVAIIYAKTEFPMACAEAARDAAGELGFEVVLYEGYPKKFTAAEIVALLEKAKAAGAGVLVGGGYLPDAVEIAKQMKAHDINFKFVSLLVGVAMPDFYEALGEDAEYFTGPTQWERGVKFEVNYGPSAEWFVEQIREKYGVEPEYHHAEAFAGCLMLQWGIERAGSLDSTMIREALNDIDIVTFFGPCRIDPETGMQIAHKMVIIQWQNGEKEIVYPTEVATSELVYPMPAWAERD